MMSQIRHTALKNNPAEHKEMIRGMFDSIAHRYDFLNHFLSLGIDILWRKKAIRLLKPLAPKNILDVATGTGDFAIEALTLNPERIYGIDLSEEMLAIGVRKIRRRKLPSRIKLMQGEAEQIPFPEGTFDAITVGFGVRNFSDLSRGLQEMNRVLRPGGMLVVLEFSKPSAFPVKQVYGLYFKSILPLIGRFFSGHKSAYEYLPESVFKFPEGKAFLALLEKSGFCKTNASPLTFGIASIYTGIKC